MPTLFEQTVAEFDATVRRYWEQQNELSPVELRALMAFTTGGIAGVMAAGTLYADALERKDTAEAVLLLGKLSKAISVVTGANI